MAVLGGISAWATGEATLPEAAQVVVTAILAIFLRMGVQKSTVAAEEAASAASDAASHIPPPKKKILRKAL